MSGFSSRTVFLGLLVLGMIAAIALPAVRRDRPAGGTCPMEFAQTRMAAILMWNAPEFTLVRAASPGGRLHPDDLRLLETETDAEECAGIAAAIPDSLKPLGPMAPFQAAFYELDGLYVASVVPHLSPKEIDAAHRGESLEHKTGVTFVFDREMRVVATAEN